MKKKEMSHHNTVGEASRSDAQKKTGGSAELWWRRRCNGGQRSQERASTQHGIINRARDLITRRHTVWYKKKSSQTAHAYFLACVFAIEEKQQRKIWTYTWKRIHTLTIRRYSAKEKRTSRTGKRESRLSILIEHNETHHSRQFAGCWSGEASLFR